jgi:hypothetical protein
MKKTSFQTEHLTFLCFDSSLSKDEFDKMSDAVSQSGKENGLNVILFGANFCSLCCICLYYSFFMYRHDRFCTR